MSILIMKKVYQNENFTKNYIINIFALLIRKLEKKCKFFEIKFEKN